MAEGFLADTKAAAGFRHANAVALVEAGNAGGEIYLAFEHHEGETLTALVAAAGAQGLPQPVALRIALDVLAALTAAHEHEPQIVPRRARPAARARRRGRRGAPRRDLRPPASSRASAPPWG